MTYRIARDALVDFVDRQIHLIESTPLPPDLRSIVPAPSQTPGSPPSSGSRSSTGRRCSSSAATEPLG